MGFQLDSVSRISGSALIDPGAVISNTAEIGALTVIGANVRVESNVKIGAGVVFATGGAGQTVVRPHCSIAAGSVIGPDVELGRGCEVRPGSAVLKSIPPNAIVEGNPAVIVGYTQGLRRGYSSDITNDELPSQSSASSVQTLGVGNAALYRMKRIKDLRGALTAGEVAKELPFVPKRYFLVFDVPSRELRGEHAHKECHQFLICVHGSCRILLDDGRDRREILLDRPDLGVYMPPLVWGTQFRYSLDAVMLVFASHVYDPSDYIRTYEEFLSLVKG